METKKIFTIDASVVYEQYNKLGNLKKVAEIYHCHHRDVKAVLDKAGFLIKKDARRSPEMIERIRNLYSIEGKTIAEISKEVNVRYKDVSKMIKANGIDSKRELYKKVKNAIYEAKLSNGLKPFTLSQSKIDEINKINEQIELEIKKEIEEKEKKEKERIAKKEAYDALPKKYCPYCGWCTIDVDGKAHTYQIHLQTKHPEIDLNEHLEKYPEDEPLLKSWIKKSKKVQCKICGKYLYMIDDRHLAKHNMTKEEYIALYGKDSVTSKETKEKLHRCWELMINNKDYDKFTSTYEKQIQEFLDNNNIKYHTHNRSILKNNEIDILLDDFPIAIEFDGNLWHTENFGKKDKFYHLNKTNICNQNNIDLIHIFEDELKYKKDLVFKMLGDILNINNKKQICEDMTFYEIKEITENDFEFFLDENSLQIFNKADKYIILCYRNEIICGISFNERNEKCIIVNNFNKISDVFPYSLIISYISQKYDKFNEIIGYADRRWYNKERNIYNSLNFIFLDYVEPIYYLYNKNNNKSIRFNRNDIEKFKNNFEIDEDITDVDKILNKINFDKIWNCGFIKYKLDLK